MVLDEKKGIFEPKIKDPLMVTGAGVEFDVCPGPGLPIDELSAQLFGSELQTTAEFGRYRSACAAQSLDPQILRRASSGGVMTSIALWLLQAKVISGVTVTRFQRTPAGPRAISCIARNRKELIHAQGSKYCPTSNASLIRECRNSGGAYLFIGTPCQVGALRLAIRKEPELAGTFPLTMANFCGGYRDYRYLDGVIRNYGLRPSNNRFFRFRGGGWPGSMMSEDARGKRCCFPYPHYDSDKYVPKQKRCTLCIDGTGLLADFACGDAWIGRFMKGEMGPDGWSIILSRSRKAEGIMKELDTAGWIRTEEISECELFHSQRSNLSSKISRQKKRSVLLKMLGQVVPQWDVVLPEGDTSYFREARILFQKTTMFQKCVNYFRITTCYKMVRFVYRHVRQWKARRSSC